VVNGFDLEQWHLLAGEQLSASLVMRRRLRSQLSHVPPCKRHISLPPKYMVVIERSWFEPLVGQSQRSSLVMAGLHSLNILLLSILFASPSLAQPPENPLKDFCRRYGHQTAVIDRKLYIDGGWLYANPIQLNPKPTMSKPGLTPIFKVWV
jgi:hypothetical protein